MTIRMEEWLDQMRQTREPGPLVRVVVVRSGRAETWMFDVTEKTDLEDLVERIEATVRAFPPYEVTESITAALRSHKSFTVLGLKGIAEGQEHVKQIITS